MLKIVVPLKHLGGFWASLNTLLVLPGKSYYGMV